MKKSLSHSIKKIYRKEPISAFIIIFGFVDSILGGFEERWTLLSLGLLIATTGLFMRWLQTTKPQKITTVSRTRRYLPPSRSSLTPLPPLKRKRDYRF
ncbi:hypothetical protein VKI21_17175 [Cyanobacterium aponinum UTEX 3222]|uniref:Uncharacterized protein n=1 Tax=Cyanobacterium aponinum AL20115 TaxID=3090662 RepID=A0AAF0ZGP1_9CHRO|nr:hypothetical protein [Cyanobacterium aponinum]PHV62930.1 hypothetical protein CSQ80_07765 [Cyanobacterium aponinum IPPAS B-1201]WPF90133.1 hypothetical protein SAY89_07645 [Cyanobacterium aponinum AL20115]WRL37767.1 hypothetical protein VKI22_14240 [Cyanobacterium aponinum UTEX 3221]WRL41755.1 hypothetical protein VKI21_17175 [Cyanobacterium aponinum UTEX 3222]